MKWAFVTGAGQRLGRAVVLELARHGWGVALHYRSSRDEADAIVQNVRTDGGEAIALQADLSDASALADLMAAAQTAANDQLAGLVNCAAIFEHDQLESLSAAALDAHMHVNTLAPVLLAREFSSCLAPGAKGAVVNFLDFKLASPYPDHLSYTLSKYALAGARRCWRAAWRHACASMRWRPATFYPRPARRSMIMSACTQIRR